MGAQSIIPPREDASPPPRDASHLPQDASPPPRDASPPPGDRDVARALAAVGARWKVAETIAGVTGEDPLDIFLGKVD